MARSAGIHFAPLRLLLLGAFRLEKGGQSVNLARRKVESLLAYLALHPEPHSREKLAALLWGEFPDADARASLRNALTILRKHLGTDLILTEQDTIQLNPDYPLWVDARALASSASGQPTSGIEIDDVKSAINFYRGNLLVDFYDEWIPPLREQYRQAYIDALLALTERRRGLSDYARAVEGAQQVLAVDPANERAHQHLMFCYHALGERQAAVEQYDKCVRALSDELGVAPSAETVALYERIKQSGTPVSSPAARLSNLPVPLTSFIGREREIAEIRRHLGKREGQTTYGMVSAPNSPGVRLLTLTGTGGSGKTRLAIESARELIPSFPDGVWWVELASVGDPALVPEAVAGALGVAGMPSQRLIDSLVNYLGAKQLLLVLDNCEHVIEACAQLVVAILSRCMSVQVLATSRDVLGVPGEIDWTVPLLSLPASQQVPPLAQLKEYEAIQLFVERGEAVKPGFALTEENAAAVTQICDRLDGIPLAIELAAARLKVLPVKQIAARLDDRFGLLTGGSRTALPRQQTLRATINWSYDLLPEPAQVLLRRLSVFVGDFSLDAVEAICGDEPLNPHGILDLLSRLVDRSLLLVVQRGEDARYRLLETIREYAAGKLAEAGESDRFRSRHLDYFVRLVEREEAHWYSATRLESFKRIESEHDNISAALESSLVLPGGFERGLRLAALLGHLWVWGSRKVEGRYWSERLLAASRERGSQSSIALARLIGAAGLLAFERREDVLARQLLKESIALCRALNDPRGLGLALLWLGLAVGQHTDSGRALADESVQVLREAGDKWALAYALGHRGAGYEFRWRRTAAPRHTAAALQDIHDSLALFEELGDRWTVEVPLGGLAEFKITNKEYAEARVLYERCISIDREAENEFGLAAQMFNLAEICCAEGDYVQAERLYADGYEVWHKCGNRQRATFALGDLARMALQRNDFARAASLITEQLRPEPDQGEWSTLDVIWFSHALVGAAMVWFASGEPVRAAQLLGAAAPTYEDAPNSLAAQNRRTEYERTVAVVRAQLDEATFDAAQAEGRTMTIEQAVKYGLVGLESGHSP